MNPFPNIKIVLLIRRKLDNAGDLLKLRDAHPDTIVVKRLDITHYEKSFKEFVQEIKVGENDFIMGMNNFLGVVFLSP